MERVTGVGGVFLRARDPLRMEDLDVMVAQLRGAGIEVEAPQEPENGRFAWAEDPEGSRFELYRPPAGA
jgi:predicted enzyme related to lactoylglutathione lyase